MKARCKRCGERAAMSPGTPLCEVCLYTEQLGADAAERQLTTAERTRRAKREARKATRR